MGPIHKDPPVAKLSSPQRLLLSHPSALSLVITMSTRPAGSGDGGEDQHVGRLGELVGLPQQARPRRKAHELDSRRQPGFDQRHGGLDVGEAGLGVRGRGRPVEGEVLPGEQRNRDGFAGRLVRSSRPGIDPSAAPNQPQHAFSECHAPNLDPGPTREGGVQCVAALNIRSTGPPERVPRSLPRSPGLIKAASPCVPALRRAESLASTGRMGALREAERYRRLGSLPRPNARTGRGWAVDSTQC